MPVRLRRASLIAGLALLALAVATFVADRLAPPPLQRFESVSTLVVDRDGRVLRAYTTPEGSWRLPADLAAIDPKLIRFLLSYEDIRCCIEDLHAKMIFYGSHSYEFKHRMGFENDPRSHLVFYPAARLERVITRPLLRFMNG